MDILIASRCHFSKIDVLQRNYGGFAGYQYKILNSKSGKACEGILMLKRIADSDAQQSVRSETHTHCHSVLNAI